MNKEIVPIERIADSIYLLRGEVMLDFDLAELYHVSTGQLNRAVKGNADRFPRDTLCFQLRPKKCVV